MGATPETDPENSEWTEEDFARARPASELPPPGSSSIRDSIHRLARERGLELGSSERRGNLPPDKTWP